MNPETNNYRGSGLQHFLTELKRRTLAFIVAFGSFLLTLFCIAAIGLLVRWILVNSDAELEAIRQRGFDKTRHAVRLDQPSMKGYNKAGSKVWEIFANEVDVSTDENTISFRKSVCKFYDEKNPKEVNIFVEADLVSYDRLSRNLSITGNLKISTKEKMVVKTELVRYIEYNQLLVFPKGVEVVTKDGNVLTGMYMQVDKELRLFEFVGKIKVVIYKLQDTGFIKERKLLKNEVRYKEFEKITILADVLIYDKDRDTILADSRSSKTMVIPITPVAIPELNVLANSGIVAKNLNPNGDPQVYFKKDINDVWCNRLIANLSEKRASCQGNIKFVINEAKPRPGDTKTLKVLSSFRTIAKSENMDYWWDEDRAECFSRTYVEQKYKSLAADSIIYYGNKKIGQGASLDSRSIYLYGNVKAVSLDGGWLDRNKLIENFKNKDIKSMALSRTEITSDQALFYLDNNLFEAEGSVHIKQKDKQANCDQVSYDDKKRTMTAEGNARYTNIKGETFNGDQIIFSLATDDIEVNGSSDALIKIPTKYQKEIQDGRDRIKKEKKTNSTSVKPNSDGRPYIDKDGAAVIDMQVGDDK